MKFLTLIVAAVLSAQQNPDIRIDVDLVTVACSVTDHAGAPANALRHIGVYGYRRDFLLEFASWAPGRLEQIEKLEQLRAMERGYRIRVVRSVAPSLEIDTPDDLARANAPGS